MAERYGPINPSFDWHNKDCEVYEGYGTIPIFDVDIRDIRVDFFCSTHNQWVSDYPVKVTITAEFADGHVETKVIERKRAEKK